MKKTLLKFTQVFILTWNIALIFPAFSQTIPIHSPPTRSPNGFLSIAAFGAIPNNSSEAANNSTRIMNCVNAARQQGKDVYIPAGLWHHQQIGSEGGAKIEGVLVYGDGPTSILFAGVVNSRAVWLGNNVSLWKLKIQHNATSRKAPWQSTGVTVFRGNNFKIWEVIVENSEAAGIHFVDAHNGVVAYCKSQSTKSDSYHIESGTSDVTFHHNEINNSGDDGIGCVSYGDVYNSNIRAFQNTITNNISGRALSVVGGRDIEYYDNIITGGVNAGILIGAEHVPPSWSTLSARNIYIHHNRLENAGGGSHPAILLTDFGVKGTGHNVRIENNIIANPKTGGIRIEGNYTDDNGGPGVITIAGNTITNTSWYGLQVVSNNVKVRVAGNTFNGIREHGIHNSGSGNELIVDRNVFTNISVAAGAHHAVSSTATLTRLQVTNSVHTQPGGYTGGSFINAPSANNVQVFSNTSPWPAVTPGNSGNQPPVANNFTESLLSGNAPITIPATTLLAHTTDTEGTTRTLIAVTNTVNGLVKTSFDRSSVIFIPNINVSSASFQYTVLDADGNIATGLCSLTSGTTPGPDNIARTTAPTIIATVRTPTGGGNRSIEIIRDGAKPNVGNDDSDLQYDTYDGNHTQPSEEFIGYTFSESYSFNSVVFQEGKHFGDGGYFSTTPRIQVLQGTSWIDVNTTMSTPYNPLQPGTSFETFTFTLNPAQTGSGIRIIGMNGGAAHFISVGEIEVYGTPSSCNPCDAGVGSGLTGRYYHNKTFTGSPIIERTDALINFNWAQASPGTGVSQDNFAIRWMGEVEAPVSGSYTFTTISDDGIRLSVNDQLLIDNWTDHAETENNGTITLAAGQRYNIMMDYYEAGGNAVARLLWTYPGQVQQVIPTSRLYPSNSIAATQTSTELNQMLSIYPNPAKAGTLTATVYADHDIDGSINIVSALSGQVEIDLKKRFKKGENVIEINGSYLKPGLHMFIINKGTERLVTRIMIN